MNELHTNQLFVLFIQYYADLMHDFDCTEETLSHLANEGIIITESKNLILSEGQPFNSLRSRRIRKLLEILRITKKLHVFFSFLKGQSQFLLLIQTISIQVEKFPSLRHLLG